MSTWNVNTMMGGRPTLGEYIRLLILPEAQLYGALARDRLLAGFADMHEQARLVEGETFQRCLESPGSDKAVRTMATLDALSDGVERYIALTNLRQATRNLLAAMTYHLFEQHLAPYGRQARLAGQRPLDWRNLPQGVSLASVPVVDELKMVTNVAKHGLAHDTKALRATRPELFHNPLYEELGQAPRDETPHAPFAGDGLFVRDADLSRYQSGVESLWLEIAAHHDVSSATAP